MEYASYTRISSIVHSFYTLYIHIRLYTERITTMIQWYRLGVNTSVKSICHVLNHIGHQYHPLSQPWLRAQDGIYLNIGCFIGLRYSAISDTPITYVYIYIHTIIYIWRFPEMGVPLNHPCYFPMFLPWFSIVNHPINGVVPHLWTPGLPVFG